jgi:hypothetical protein
MAQTERMGQMARTKWTPQLLGKMLAWKKERNASNKMTAEHFKVSAKSFQTTLNRYGKIKLGKLATQYGKPTAPVMFEVPEQTQEQPQILPAGNPMSRMVAVMSVDAFQELMQRGQ